MAEDLSRSSTSLEDTVRVGGLVEGHAPHLVGRYELIRELGRGAMGVVFLATDMLLARKVALKLVESARPTPALSRQVAREAQTVARMQHPNVVSLFDVVQADSAVYLAMEYVEGPDLATWLKTPRTRKEIVSVFVQCADGLAAAHEAGVVHRDFKPSNVLLGLDGRARVSDFGLAGFLADPHDGPTLPSAQRLAHTAATLGTPAYMAPEVWEGQPAGPAADQFSFCVALYEALFQERPFEGESPQELFAAIRDDRRKPLPAGRRVPPDLARLLERGLEYQPSRRYPSMRELAADLRRTQGGRGVRVGAVVATLVVAAGATWVMTQRQPVCGSFDGHLASLRVDVPAGLVSTGLSRLEQPWVPGLAARAESRLQAFSEAWARMRQDACEATRVRGEQSEALLDRRMLCLVERRQALTSTARLLATAELEVARRGDALLDALGDVSPCADARSLLEAAARPPTESSRTRLAAAEAQLTEARVLSVAGRLREALALATAALVEVRLYGTEWDVAAAALVVGATQRELEEAAAAQTLHEAIQLAIRSRNFEVERLAWLERIQVSRNHLAALDFEGVARAAIERVGGPRREELLARLEGILGRHALEGGDFAVAAAHFEAAQEASRALGPLARAAAEQQLGVLAGRRERREEAIDHARRAASLIEESAGPAHPHLGVALSVLAWELLRARRFDEAEQAFARALGILEASLGPRHGEVADVLDGMGWLMTEEAKYERAEPLLKRAQALRVSLAGADSQEAGRSANQLASFYLRVGRHAEAVPKLEEAARIYEKELGPSHPRLAMVMHNLAEARLAAGDPAGAVLAAERALAIALEVHGARGAPVMPEYVVLAQAERAVGRPLAVVMKHYEAALALADVAPEDELALARLRFAELLATVDRPRARAVVALARPFYEQERKAGRLEDEVKDLDRLIKTLGP